MSKLYDENPNQLGNYQSDFSTDSSGSSSGNSTKSVLGFLQALPVVGQVATAIDTVTGGADHRARKNMRTQASLNEAAADRNFERSRLMWQMQNKYDLPVNQMERYQNASINPNAVISGVTGNSPATMSSPDVSYHAPDLNAARAAEYSRSQLLMDSMQQMANINLTNAQADNVKSDTKNKNIQNDFLPQLLQNQIDLGFAQIELTDSQKNLTDEQVQQTYQTSLKIQEEMHEIRATVNLIKEQTDNMKIKNANDLLSYCYNEQSFDKLLKKLDLENKLTGANINQVRAATAKLWAETFHVRLQNTFQRQLNEFGRRTFNDKLSMFKTNKMMLDNNFKYQKIHLQNLSKLDGYNQYLQTFKLAGEVIREYLGIPADILSLPGKVIGSIFE